MLHLIKTDVGFAIVQEDGEPPYSNASPSQIVLFPMTVEDMASLAKDYAQLTVEQTEPGA